MSEPKLIKGGTLRPSAKTLVEFQRGFYDLVDAMTKETKRELLELFKSPVADVLDSVEMRTARELGWKFPPPEVPAMDASLADMAEGIMNKLHAKFTVMFDRAATGLTDRMMSQTLLQSAKGLEGSLKGVSKTVTLDMTPELKEMVDAGSAEAVSLIKRVPAEYLPKVQGDVMRSITTGNGLQDLIPDLDKQNVKVKNWAVNVAKDQTRKAYGNINKARMVNNGMDKYEWIHSGGSNKPRKYHLDATPSGLNGRICSLSDPPIIDENTGERGIPGQLPYCGCTMRPIFSFDED